MSNVLAFKFIESVERKDDKKDFATMANLKQSELNFARSQQQQQQQQTAQQPQPQEQSATTTTSTGSSQQQQQPARSGSIFAGMRHLQLQTPSRRSSSSALAAAHQSLFFHPFSHPSGTGVQLTQSGYVDSLQTAPSGVMTASSHYFNPHSQNSSLAGAQSGNFIPMLGGGSLASHPSNANFSTTSGGGAAAGSFTDIIQSLQLHHQSYQQQVYQDLQLHREQQHSQDNVLLAAGTEIGGGGSSSSQQQQKQQKQQQQNMENNNHDDDNAAANSAGGVRFIDDGKELAAHDQRSGKQRKQSQQQQQQYAQTGNPFYDRFSPEFVSQLQQASQGPTTISEVYALACEKYGCGTNTGIAKQLVEVDVEHVEWISEHHQRFDQLLVELNKNSSSQKQQQQSNQQEHQQQQQKENADDGNDDDDEENSTAAPMMRQTTANDNNQNEISSVVHNASLHTATDVTSTQAPDTAHASFASGKRRSDDQTININDNNNNNQEDQDLIENNHQKLTPQTSASASAATPMTSSTDHLPLRRKWRPVTLDDIQQILKQDSDDTYIDLVSSAAIHSQNQFSSGSTPNVNDNTEEQQEENVPSKKQQKEQTQEENIKQENDSASGSASSSSILTSSSTTQQQEQQIRQFAESLRQQPPNTVPSYFRKPHGAIRPLVTVFDLGNRNMLNANSLRAFLDVCIICFPNLTRLIIGDVNLDEKGIRVLSEAIDKMPKLASVDLRGNRNLFASSARLLVETVQRNPKLLEMRMDSDNVPPRILSALKIAIASNTAQKCPVECTAKRKKMNNKNNTIIKTVVMTVPDSNSSSTAPTNEENSSRIVESPSIEQQQQQNENNIQSKNNDIELVDRNESSGFMTLKGDSSGQRSESAVFVREDHKQAAHRRTYSADEHEEGEDPGAGCFSATVSFRPHPPTSSKNNNNTQSQQQQQQQQNDAQGAGDESSSPLGNTTNNTYSNIPGEDSSSPASLVTAVSVASGSPYSIATNENNAAIDFVAANDRSQQQEQQQQQQQQQPFQRRKFLPQENNTGSGDFGKQVSSSSEIMMMSKYNSNNTNANNNTNEKMSSLVTTESSSSSTTNNNKNNKQTSTRDSIVKECIFRIGYSAIQLASDLGDELFEKKFAKQFLLNDGIVPEEIKPSTNLMMEEETVSSYFDRLLDRLEKRRQYLLRTAKNLEGRINLNNEDLKKSIFDLDDTDLLVTKQLFTRVYLLLEPWRIERKSIMRQAKLLWEDKQEEQKQAIFLASRPTTKQSSTGRSNRKNNNGDDDNQEVTRRKESPLPEENNNQEHEQEQEELLDQSIMNHFEQRRKLEAELEKEKRELEELDKLEQEERAANESFLTLEERNARNRRHHNLLKQQNMISYDHCDNAEEDFPTSNRSLGSAALREAAKLLNAIRSKVLVSTVFRTSLDAKRILFNDPVLRVSSLVAVSAEKGCSSYSQPQHRATADLRGYTQCTGEWPEEEEEKNNIVNHHSLEHDQDSGKLMNTSNLTQVPSAVAAKQQQLTTAPKIKNTKQQTPLPSIHTKEGIAARVQILEDYLIEKHMKISRRLVLLHDRMKYLEHEYKNMVTECTDRYRSVTPFPFVVSASSSSSSLSMSMNKKLRSSSSSANSSLNVSSNDNTTTTLNDLDLLLLQRETDSVVMSSYTAERRRLFQELFSLFPSTVSDFFLELFTSRIVTRWQNMQDVTDVMLAMSSSTNTTSGANSSSSNKQNSNISIHLLNFVAEDILKYQKQQDQECFEQQASSGDSASASATATDTMSKILRAENNQQPKEDDEEQHENDEDDEDLITGFSKNSSVRGTGGLLPISFADSFLPAPKLDVELAMTSSKYLEADIFDMIKRCFADEEAVRKTVVAVVCRKALKEVLGE